MKRILHNTYFRLFLTLILLALPIAGVFWLYGDKVFKVILYVLSGQLFQAEWNRIHAGTALDQPTIGSRYFRFTFFAVFTLPYLALMKKFLIPKTKLHQWLYAITASLICLFLFCQLTIPFHWLNQYMNEMGPTARRSAGVLYGMAGYAIMFIFLYRAFKFIRKNKNPTADDKKNPLQKNDCLRQEKKLL